MTAPKVKKISQLPITEQPSLSGTTVIVQGGVTYQVEFNSIKENLFTPDHVVTSGSTNTVTSGAVYTAIDEQNIPNADKVGNDTPLVNEDRGYFYNTITGWFYVQWSKLVNLLRGGAGAFSQPVYLTTTASDISGYTTLSYNNEINVTEFSVSTNESPLVFLYPAGLLTTSIPNGPYFFSFRCKLSSKDGETYIKVTSFVRDIGGNERDLFFVQSEDIDSTSYVDIGIRELKPSYVVTPTERYGIRVEAVTNHNKPKTITFEVGGSHSGYFTTPVPLRHDLLRGTDEPNLHPAKSITVSESPVPDYTAPALNNTLQDITNKVAGLQIQTGGKVNELGSITGANEIDLSDGTFVTATLTGAVELSFTGLPTVGFVKDFVLLFTNIETITFPVGTMFAGGVPPVVITSPYMFVCSIDSAGVLTVYTLLDNIIVPV